MITKNTIIPNKKQHYHRDTTLSTVEVMLIIIIIHVPSYRCLKLFYQAKVCQHLRHFFPNVVSFNRFVELNYGKLIADKGYISKSLFHRLFVDGIQLITKLKSNIKGALISVLDNQLLRKRAIIETVNDELEYIALVECSIHRFLIISL